MLLLDTGAFGAVSSIVIQDAEMPQYKVAGLTLMASTAFPVYILPRLCGLVLTIAVHRFFTNSLTPDNPSNRK